MPSPDQPRLGQRVLGRGRRRVRQRERGRVKGGRRRRRRISTLHPIPPPKEGTRGNDTNPLVLPPPAVLGRTRNLAVQALGRHLLHSLRFHRLPLPPSLILLTPTLILSLSLSPLLFIQPSLPHTSSTARPLRHQTSRLLCCPQSPMSSPSRSCLRRRTR
jgi:hypothetical protein